MKKFLFCMLSACCSYFFSFAQHVGIGTSAPVDKLHVAAGNMTIENGTTNYPWLSFRNNNTYKGYIGVNNNDLRIGTWPVSNTTGHIALVTNNFDRIRIMSDGDVGINTTTPRGIFDIGGSDQPIYLASNTTVGNQRIAYLPGDIFMAPWAGSNISYLEARRSDNSGSTNLQFRTYFSGFPRDAFFISSDGKIGINTNNPGATVEVLQRGTRGFLLQNPNGDNWEQTVSYDNNGFPPPTLGFYHNGTLKAQVSNVTGVWSSVSDARLKRNIVSLTPVLDKLNKLIPCSYEMINDNSQKERTIGFIAQEVKNIFPEVVNTTPAKLHGAPANLYTLNYTALGVVAIKAIQEQQKIIEELQVQVNELRLILGNLNKKQ